MNQAVFSSGPCNEIIAYRDFMDWTTPWFRPPATRWRLELAATSAARRS